MLLLYRVAKKFRRNFLATLFCQTIRTTSLENKRAIGADTMINEPTSSHKRVKEKQEPLLQDIIHRLMAAKRKKEQQNKEDEGFLFVD